MSDLIKFSIPGKPEYVQMARLAIASIAGKAEFDVDTVEDITAALSEACKNVFCHGFSRYSNRYEIYCEINDKDMTITVKDSCIGHDLEKINKPCTHCPDEGNLSLIVIESFMDSVETETDKDGNKSIKMVKNK